MGSAGAEWAWGSNQVRYTTGLWLSGEVDRSKLEDRDDFLSWHKVDFSKPGSYRAGVIWLENWRGKCQSDDPIDLMMLATGHDSGATSTWRSSLCILPPPPDLHPPPCDLCPPSSVPSPDLTSQPLSSLDLPVSDSFCPLEADKWWALESALSFYTKTDITFLKHLVFF